MTGWMVFAMKSAEEGKLKIDKAAYNDAINWFDEMTDPGTDASGTRRTPAPAARAPA